MTGLLVLDLFYFKDIDHIYVGTAEANGVLFLTGQLTAVSEDVNIRESDMLSHGAERAAFRVPVPCVPDQMAMMASHGSFLVD